MKMAKQGFSLIESLIAIVIFAIGFMGLAALQLKAIQISESTHHRYLAVNLAKEMAERLNSNPVALTSNGYFGASSQNTACLGSVSPFECTPDQLAQHELYEWQTAVANQLPGGVAIVCRDSTPNDGTALFPSCSDLASSNAPIAIKLWWQGPSDQSIQTYNLSLAL